MRFANRRNRQNIEISILNLIDVIFMLLIFFMIATTFNNYAQFHLSVPKTSTEYVNDEDTVIEIIIDENQQYYIKIGESIRNVTLENMKDEFSELSASDIEKITLTADEHLEYGIIVEAMGELKNLNVKNINLNIQKNEK